MSETAGLLADAAGRLFDAHLDEAAVRRAGRGEWLADAWAAMEAMGLPLALLSEAQGGFGAPTGEALGLVRLAGAYACPLPLGETLVANRVLAEAGLPLADGPAALAPAAQGVRLAPEGDGWRLTGTVARMAWGQAAETLVVEVAQDGARRIVRLDRGAWRTATAAVNLAGQPRDDLAFDVHVAAVALSGRDLMLEGAAVRTLLIAGALDRVLELVVEHVNSRVQFGRPLARFQAVQHLCAELAGETAAAGASADIAADALAGPPEAASLAIAAAKLRAGEAAGRSAALAHQLHGAIGFTAEHRLHLYTTALWAWREEFGGHRTWAARIGRRALTAGPQGFWPLVIQA